MSRSSSFLFIIFFTQFFIRYVDPHKIICPPGKAQFPNPDDRYSFYKCDAGGNPILFPCPAKTWFNPCLEVCDWDTGNYNCGENGGTSYPSNTGSNGNETSYPSNTGSDRNETSYPSNTGGDGNEKGKPADKYPPGPTNSGSGNSNNVININIIINGDKTGDNNGKNPHTGVDGNRPQDPSQSGPFPNQPIPPSHGGYRPQPNSSTKEGTTQADKQGPPTKLAPNQSCSTYGLLYQNPDDCSTYFMCNQRLVLVHCTRGHFYIPERKRCETTIPKGCKFVEDNIQQYQRGLKG